MHRRISISRRSMGRRPEQVPLMFRRPRATLLLLWWWRRGQRPRTAHPRHLRRRCHLHVLRLRLLLLCLLPPCLHSPLRVYRMPGAPLVCCLYLLLLLLLLLQLLLLALREIRTRLLPSPPLRLCRRVCLARMPDMRRTGPMPRARRRLPMPFRMHPFLLLLLLRCLLPLEVLPLRLTHGRPPPHLFLWASVWPPRRTLQRSGTGLILRVGCGSFKAGQTVRGLAGSLPCAPPTEAGKVGAAAVGLRRRASCWWMQLRRQHPFGRGNLPQKRAGAGEAKAAATCLEQGEVVGMLWGLAVPRAAPACRTSRFLGLGLVLALFRGQARTIDVRGLLLLLVLVAAQLLLPRRRPSADEVEQERGELERELAMTKPRLARCLGLQVNLPPRSTSSGIRLGGASRSDPTLHTLPPVPLPRAQRELLCKRLFFLIGSAAAPAAPCATMREVQREQLWQGQVGAAWEAQTAGGVPMRAKKGPSARVMVNTPARVRAAMAADRDPRVTSTILQRRISSRAFPLSLRFRTA